MSDNEIKLTDTNNKTSNGIPFPQTPKPQVIKENFAYIEINSNNNNINIKQEKNN